MVMHLDGFRSAITRQCEILSGVDGHERKPKELDIARIKRHDTLDCCSKELICLSSGVVASDEVKSDLLKAL